MFGPFGFSAKLTSPPHLFVFFTDTCLLSENVSSVFDFDRNL